MEDPKVMQEKLLRDALRDIREDQKKLANDFLALRMFIVNYMQDETKNIHELRVIVTRLEEQAKNQKNNWGIVQTILTSSIITGITIAISRMFA